MIPPSSVEKQISELTADELCALGTTITERLDALRLKDRLKDVSPKTITQLRARLAKLNEEIVGFKREEYSSRYTVTLDITITPVTYHIEIDDCVGKNIDDMFDFSIVGTVTGKLSAHDAELINHAIEEDGLRILAPNIHKKFKVFKEKIDKFYADLETEGLEIADLES